jgi:cell division septum initiation protein DivIVA
MSRKELKQYVEKELHAKKFLQEGLDVINTIEGLEEDLWNVKEDIKKETAKRSKALSDREDAETSLKKVASTLEAKTAEAEKITSNAKEQADQIVSDAKKEADRLIDAAKAELATLSKDITKAKFNKDELTKSVNSLTSTKDELVGELEKLHKKFAIK